MTKGLTFDVVLAQLRGLGGHRIEVEYSGSGDSGGIDNLVMLGQGDKRQPGGQIDVPASLLEVLEEYIEQLFEQAGISGFCDDGASGQITIDLLTLKVRHTCTIYETVAQQQPLVQYTIGSRNDPFRD